SGVGQELGLGRTSRSRGRHRCREPNALATRRLELHSVRVYAEVRLRRIPYPEVIMLLKFWKARHEAPVAVDPTTAWYATRALDGIREKLQAAAATGLMHVSSSESLYGPEVGKSPPVDSRMLEKAVQQGIDASRWDGVPSVHIDLSVKRNSTGASLVW